MKCPVCKSHENSVATLRAGSFATRLVECRICATLWSVSRGSIEVVRDVQEKSFLEAVTECVEGDDYYLVG
jgi:hypothetical protein